MRQERSTIPKRDYYPLPVLCQGVKLSVAFGVSGELVIDGGMSTL